MSIANFAAFGTGDTPPNATDLLLESQVGSRSNDNGGFSNADDGALDAANNLMWYQQEFTRVFNISSPVVAREWGLAPQATGNLTARDLFRDLSNNPTAIPLEEGDQLQLNITLYIEAAWEYEPASFVIAGTPGHDTNGTHDGVATVSSGAGTTAANIRDALRGVWPGPTGTSSNQSAVTVCLASQAGRAKNEDLVGTRVRSVITLDNYTPGNFYRDHQAVFSTSEANGDHYAWVAGLNVNNENMGLRFILTDPQFMTKTDSERLVLTVRKSVARA